MKRFLALLLAALCLLACLSGCVAGGADQAAETDSQLAPEQAATQAAESTQDKMSLSDIIRVPFGYLLEWLYQFANNYGVALILFSLIVKLVLLPMSIKSKKSMLKMSRLAPLARSIEAKYGDDRQKAQMAVQPSHCQKRNDGMAARSTPRNEKSISCNFALAITATDLMASANSPR